MTAPTIVRAQASARQLRVISFPGSYNLLLWAGIERGFFAARGLDVAITLTPTSQHLIRELIAGNFEVATSSIDNVIAYNSGQGEAALPRPADLFAFMSIAANSSLPLIARPEIAKIADLRGKLLAVDAVSTGFSFVLRAILAAHGLQDDDYRLDAVGNAEQRLAALIAGSHQAAVLTPPFDAMAERAGMIRLGSSTDAFADYQATGFIASRRWADDHRAALLDFIRALLAIEDWVKQPENHADAAAALMAHSPGMAQAGAQAAVKRLIADLIPDLNLAGIEQVIALRRRYGEPKTEIGGGDRFIDRSYLDQARR